MANFYAKPIPFASIGRCVPNRDDFISKTAEYAEISRLISKRAELLFLPTYLKQISAYEQNSNGDYELFYKICLMGILRDGRRITVVIDGIAPFFEVLLNSNSAEEWESMKDHILTVLENNSYAPCKSTYYSAKPFKYYKPNKSKFLRLYYNNIKSRVSAIKIVRNLNYETASDDTGSYYRVVCRDHLISFSSWVQIKDYEITYMKQLKGEVYRVNLSNYKAYDQELKDDLLKDKTMSCCWDIETWSSDGKFPMPENKNANLFCLSMTFQWVNEPEPFFRVCLCDKPATPRPEFMTIVCGNERNIIDGFSQVFAKLRPEFIVGFNDSSYDWHWITCRGAIYTGLLAKMATNMDCTNPYKPHTDKSVLEYWYKHDVVKLEAGGKNIDSYTLSLPGYIAVDVCTIMRKLAPTTEQYSLKYFLSINKLESKADMPYTEMHNINTVYREFISQYESKELLSGQLADIKPASCDVEKYEYLKSRFAAVNYYCMVDSKVLHYLLRKNCVFMDHRALSHSAYTSVHDAFFKANGMKVRQLTIAIGQKKPFNIRFSNITPDVTEEGKYPGAYVLPPKKGLNVSKLSMKERVEVANDEEKQRLLGGKFTEWKNITETELDKYYKIIEKHGAVATPEIATEALRESPNLPQHFIDFWTEPIKRPIVGLDFASLYPSLMRAYNFSPEMCVLDRNFAKELANKGVGLTKVKFVFNGITRKAWFIKHNNKYDPNDKDFMFGVFPYILDDLFKKRAIVKAELKVIDKRLEVISAMSDKERERPEIAAEYEDLSFRRGYINGKQSAIKVFMNTFYGEAGNKNSPFFVVEVAGGVTSYGQINIKEAYRIVTEMGCNVYYGDTDSLYLAVPEHHFITLDRNYYAGSITKLEYWTDLVKLTMKGIDEIRDAVNSFFIKDNGTKFLSMAYEEVLWPVLFAAKKKYLGVPHEHIPNFKPDKLFIRGFDLKKRGVSVILRKVSDELMWKMCDITNTYEVIEMVRIKIDEIYARNWDYKDFIKTAVYNPQKDNKQIQTLARRMAERGNPIKPNERFNYMICKKYPYKYDWRGRKEELSMGDKIELTEEFLKNNMEIDIDYYMKGGINGQLARLIAYHDDFKVDVYDNNADTLKKAEIKIYANACKYIDDYCSKYYSTYNTFGKAYQKIFKTSNSVLTKAVSNYDSFAGNILSANVAFDKFANWYMSYIEKKVKKSAESYGKEFVERLLKCYPQSERKQVLSQLQACYYGHPQSITRIREAEFKNRYMVFHKRITDSHANVIKTFESYNSSISKLNDVLKDKLNIGSDLRKPMPVNESFEFKLEDFIDGKTFSADMVYDIEYEAKCETSKLFERKDFTNAIADLKKLYAGTYAMYSMIWKTRSISMYLKVRRDTSNRFINRPDDIDEKLKNDRSTTDELASIDI